MLNSGPLPPFMEKTILNFHFDYLHPLLSPLLCVCLYIALISCLLLHIQATLGTWATTLWATVNLGHCELGPPGTWATGNMGHCELGPPGNLGHCELGPL